MKKFTVNVKPSSRESRIEQGEEGRLLARVKSAPVNGKANAELIGLLAKYLKVPKSRIGIKSGSGGRTKLVVVKEGDPR